MSNGSKSNYNIFQILKIRTSFNMPSLVLYLIMLHVIIAKLLCYSVYTQVFF